MITNTKWAYAIAQRIADEWHGKEYDPEDATKLATVLYKSLKNNPEGCKRLIGTTIIEEDYFEQLL